MSAGVKKRPAMGWLFVALAVGMLIWVRLRLVTDIPRSAYADPEKRSEPAGSNGQREDQTRVSEDEQGRIASGDGR